MPDEAWVVIVAWLNSSPTVHGTWPTSWAAARWALDTLGRNPACASYEVELMARENTNAVLF